MTRSLRTATRTEMRLHRAHRKREQRAVIAQLKWRSRQLLSSGLTKYDLEVIETTQEIRRVQDLDTATMLHDRECLLPGGSSPPRR